MKEDAFVKICPTCQQTYADEGLNFCLNDGAVLVKKDASSLPPNTVFMNPGGSTNPNNFQNPTGPVNWGNAAGAVSQPKPKSRAWLWVLGILGAVVFGCGGGFLGLVALVANSNNGKNTSNYNYSNTNTRTNSFSNYGTKTTSNILTDDLSKWKMPDASLGQTDFRSGEFYMTSKSGGYYFALLSGSSSFQTGNALTRVTVRNSTGAPTTTGFGLMIHNNIAVALAQDYAFLIDSSNQSYRVAKHQTRKETPVVKWTYDSVIKNGTQANLLEVRDTGGKMDFYINGKLVTTVQDKDGIKSGVPGLYAGGAIPIAFSNLQVEK